MFVELTGWQWLEHGLAHSVVSVLNLVLLVLLWREARRLGRIASGHASGIAQSKGGPENG